MKISIEMDWPNSQFSPSTSRVTTIFEVEKAVRKVLESAVPVISMALDTNAARTVLEGKNEDDSLTGHRLVVNISPSLLSLINTKS